MNGSLKERKCSSKDKEVLLTPNDKLRLKSLAAKTAGSLLFSDWYRLAEPLKPWRALFEHLFLRYGAGAKVFRPIVDWRFFNRLAWIAIVFGIFGWACFVWYLRTHFSDE